MTGEGKKTRKSPLHITEKSLLGDIYCSEILPKLQNEQNKYNIFDIIEYYLIAFLQRKKNNSKTDVLCLQPHISQLLVYSKAGTSRNNFAAIYIQALSGILQS